MSKKRYVSDSFWSDNWVEDLDPLEKYLFLYLLTNQLVSICGIYEIKIKRIAFETGIDKDMILKMFERFEKVKKVYYNEGIICIVNFVKNQNIVKKEDNLWKGIEREVNELGKEKLALILNYKDLTRTLQGAYKDVDILYLTLLNLTLLNLEEEKSKEIITQNLKNFETLVKEEILLNIDFINSLKIKYNLTDQDIKKELEFFYLYWSEKNKSGKKEKWELEKTFEIRKRFYKWLDNSKKRSNKNNFNKKSVGITSID